MAVGKFAVYEFDENANDYVENKNNLKIEITVDETFDNNHRVVSQRNSPVGQFTFTSLDSGEHKFCITPKHTNWSKKAKHRVFFDLIVGDAKPLVDSKRDSDVSFLTLKTNELIMKLNNIKREQSLLRLKEATFRDTSESVNSSTTKCIHPKPTKPENIATCSDDGVIGPCVGLVGTLMSIETIKILTKYYNTETNPYKPVMLVYSGYMANDGQMLKTFKMRGKKPDCLCGKLSKEMIENINYSQFCGKIDYDVLNDKHRINFANLSALENPVIVDVRPKEQFAISNLRDQENFKVINIPYTSLIRLDDKSLQELLPKDSPIVAVCKMGNDSRLSTKYLLGKGFDVYDLRGGLNEYSKTHNFHVYW
ncbi:hypothetical protein PMKS-003621 [Pichia membranifaciens]|uniref:Rhodanese domain-containing protein n=1 Tax=Pichia membranifaciens TaxID=4926 RepID=A0A1Q2YKQ7_9ASCO|nr:hypothetical protein PMKS-003621 [Pichia membranifaciens]